MGKLITILLKPTSWTYNFVEVSGHNLESSQTWVFQIQCLHYKPVSNHFCSREEGVKSISRGDCEKQREKLKTFVPITSMNSASGPSWNISVGGGHVISVSMQRTHIYRDIVRIWLYGILLFFYSRACKATMYCIRINNIVGLPCENMLIITRANV